MGEKFYVYILHSLKTNRYYVGQTNDLERRLMYHNSGYNPSTKSGIPWELVYVEEYSSKQEAFNREQEIKKKKSRKYIEELISRAQF
ncbi:MAG: GIY-YIG nuclease family protein [Ignavibacteria bacterium]|nr:GIY-YIG nuclease family protein [Ignavibacteria bacterium]